MHTGHFVDCPGCGRKLPICADKLGRYYFRCVGPKFGGCSSSWFTGIPTANDAVLEHFRSRSGEPAPAPDPVAMEEVAAPISAPDPEPEPEPALSEAPPASEPELYPDEVPRPESDFQRLARLCGG